MKLPKKITPCPIREAVAEVRFVPNVPPDAVFGIVYQAIKADFPDVQQLPILGIPSEVRDVDSKLAYQPHYRLQNRSTTLLVGPRKIAVGTRGEYPGWVKLSAEVNSIFSRLNATGIVKSSNRFGLRYINFFKTDIFKNLLLQMTVNGESWDKEATQFKTRFRGPKCSCWLQVFKDMTWQGKPPENGSVIDIDAFTESTSGEFGKVFADFLEDAHAEEKKLFFSLLKPEFLTTLNPVYEE